MILESQKGSKILGLCVLVSGTLFLASCTRQQPIANDPPAGEKFGFELRINGSTRVIDADKGNYYMYTSYETDSGLTIFRGAMKEEGCTACRDFIEIDINSYTKGTFEIDKAIRKMDYEMAYKYGSDKYKVRFYTLDPNGASTYTWNFGDTLGSSSTALVPEFLYKTPGVYNVTLTQNSSQCNESTTQKVYAGVPEPLCKTRLLAIREDSINFTFVTQTTGAGKSTFDYFWDFGDGTTMETKLLQNHKKFPASKDYRVRLVTVDLNSNCRDTIEYLVNARTQQNYCNPNFNFTNEGTLAYTPLSKVKIRYVNVDGVEFVSDNFEQDSSSKFVITDVIEGDYNENGQRTKRIACTFKVRLYNVSGNFIDVESPASVFAIAYP